MRISDIYATGRKSSESFACSRIVTILKESITMFVKGVDSKSD